MANQNQAPHFWPFGDFMGAGRAEGEGVDHRPHGPESFGIPPPPPPPFGHPHPPPSSQGFGHPPPPPPPPPSHPFPFGFGAYGWPGDFRDLGFYDHHRGHRGHNSRRGRHFDRSPSGSRSGSSDAEDRHQGQKGRHGRHNKREGHPDHSSHRSRSRDRSPHPEHSGSPHEGAEDSHNNRAPPSQGPQIPFHFGPRERRFGGAGRRSGRGRHGGPPPPFGYPGGAAAPFEFSAVLGALSSHPIAQALQTYIRQSGVGNEQAQRGTVERPVSEPADEGASYEPPVDIFSTPSAYILHVAIPGAKKEDVGVNWDAEKGELNVLGVVYRQGDEALLQSLTKAERKVGVFERALKLPPVGDEKVDIHKEGIVARLEDGVLYITVPKVEKDKEWTEVKRIEID